MNFSRNLHKEVHLILYVNTVYLNVVGRITFSEEEMIYNGGCPISIVAISDYDVVIQDGNGKQEVVNPNYLVADGGFMEIENAIQSTKWQTGTPPEYTDLLIFVTFPKEIMVRPKMAVGFCDDVGVWRACGIRISGTVTHWQPLPNPPNNGLQATPIPGSNPLTVSQPGLFE